MILRRRCIESILLQEITHKENIHNTKSKLDRYIWGAINNEYPQKTVKEGMVEVVDSSGDSGDEWFVGVSG